jgi:hypothetical protein
MTEKLNSLCPRCGRIIGHYSHARSGNLRRGEYAYIVHDYYGCDTGCCGHKAYLCDEDGQIIDEVFKFIHPGRMSKKEFVSSYIHSLWCNIKIDWEKCEISDN